MQDNNPITDESEIERLENSFPATAGRAFHAAYHRSLGLLTAAIRHTNRAYLFDNSSDGEERAWIDEVTDGRTLELKTNQVPAWLTAAVLVKTPSMPVNE